MFFKSLSANAKNAASKNALTPVRTSKKSVPSVIAEDVSFLGNIISEGMIDFDGKIDGNIHCQTAIIRPSGIVNGEVIADTVQVYGTVKGLIKAKNVHLYASAVVEGIIMHEAITIQDGARIDGKFKRTNKAAAQLRHDASESMDDDFDGGMEAPKVLEGLRLIAQA